MIFSARSRPFIFFLQLCWLLALNNCFEGLYPLQTSGSGNYENIVLVYCFFLQSVYYYVCFDSIPTTVLTSASYLWMNHHESSNIVFVSVVMSYFLSTLPLSCQVALYDKHLCDKCVILPAECVLLCLFATYGGLSMISCLVIWYVWQ